MKKPRIYFSKKLIDIHTHAEGIDFYNYTHGFTPTSMETLLMSQIIEASKANLAVTFPIQNTMYFTPNSYISNQPFSPSGIMSFPFEIENSRLLDSIKYFKIDNLLPFLSFSLNDMVSEQVEFLDDRIKTDYVYGLKYHPQCDRHTVLEIDDFPILLKLLKQHSLPLLVHTGKSGVANPMHILEFAKKHPDIRICIAHLGRFKQQLFEKHFENPLKNVYFDMSPFDYLFKSINNDAKFLLNNEATNKSEAILAIYQKLNSHLLWGSDFPWINSIELKNASTEDKWDYNSVVETLLDLPSEVINDIASKNTLDYIYGEDNEY